MNNIGQKVAPLMVLAAVASLVTFLSMQSIRLEQMFFENYPRFYDPLSYDFYNINLFQDVQHAGRLATAFHEILYNDRHPLRTVPLILFCPRFLGKEYGHLWTGLPMTFCFVFLLAWTAWRRTKLLIFSLAVPAVICAIPGLMNPAVGIAANWLDIPAAMASGAAVLSLLVFAEKFNLAWLFLFGIFASVTVLSRWSAGLYLGFYSGPMLVWLFFRLRHANQDLRKPVMLFLLSVLPGLAFGLGHLQNFTYYKTFNYGLNAPILDCFANVCWVLKKYVGTPILVTLAIITLTNLVSIFTSTVGDRKIQIRNGVAALLFPIAIVFFICVVVRISGEIHSSLYVIPAIFVGAIASSQRLRGLSKLLQIAFSLFMLLLSGLTLTNTYNQDVAFAHDPPVGQKIQKAFDLNLAKYLAAGRISTYAEYDDERGEASAESFYKWGWLPKSVNYSSHEAYWKGYYPMLSPFQVATKMYADNVSRVGLVCIFDNKNDLATASSIDNAYSREVATYMTEHVPMDHRWKKVSELRSIYGNVSLYENTTIKSVPNAR